jgi:2-deoxy-D-gluconate 3-dehydrogenase
VRSLTGATRGIGANLALAISKAGADLILVQRNSTNTTTADVVKAQGGLNGQGGKADIVVCDLADKVAVGGLIGKVTGEMGRTLDIVVNCGACIQGPSQGMLMRLGGIQRRHPVESFPDDDWNEVLQVNLNTVFAITRDAGSCLCQTTFTAPHPYKAYFYCR